MNENIDLTKILKNCPKGTKLYSILHGEVEYEGISEKDSYKVRFRNKDGNIERVKPDGRYFSCFNGECVLLPSKDQRDWSKFTAPWYKNERFDPKTLQPFDRVLVRGECKGSIWRCSLFSNYIDNSAYAYCTNSGSYKYCIPYNEETKYLVGTTKEAPEFYRYWED